MARINAIIKDFQSNVRKAQRLAKTAVPNEIETKVNANIRSYQRELTRAKSMAQRWRGHSVKLFMKTDEYKANLERAKAQVERFKQHKVDLKLSNTELMAKYNATKATVEAWRKHVVKLDLDANPAKMAVKGFKEDLIDLSRHSFDVDSSRWKLGNKFTKEFNEVEGAVKRSFGRIGQIMRKEVNGTSDIWGKLNNSLKDYGEKMDALATKIRTFGTIFAQQVKGLMIASIQALIPVIAGLVPAIMAVLNAVGVLGGGVLGLAGAFSVAGVGAVGFGAMAISALKMVEDGTLAVTKEVQDFRKASNQLKDTWQGIVKENQSKIFNAMSSGLRGVTSALTQMKPFLSEASMLVEANVRKFEEWVKTSNTAKKAFESLNGIGGAVFGDLLNAAGRFGDGLVNVFTQMMPLFKFVSQGLQNMSIAFQDWANSVAGQNAIKSFIEYTKTNLPKIGKIFGNVFKGIGNLMIAFGQNSSNIFDWLVKLTDKFKKWSEEVGKSQGFKDFIKYVQDNGPTIMQLIGNIVKALVAFGTAMAPIASKLLEFITTLAGFIAKLFEAHPGVAKFIGVLAILGGAFWAMMAPIIAVGAVLSNVFGITLLDIGRKIQNFAKNSRLLSGAFNVLRGAFKFLLNPMNLIRAVLPLLQGGFALLAGAITSISWPILAVVGVIAGFVAGLIYLWKTNEGFRKTVTTAWESVKEAVSGAIEKIVGWLTDLWNKVQETIQPIIPILETLGDIFMSVLGDLVKNAIVGVMNAVQGLWTLITIAFKTIGTIISVAVQIIVGIFTALIQFLTGDLSGAWETIKTTVSNVLDTIWEHIQSVWNSIIGFLTDVMDRTLSLFGTSWSQIWSTITGFVSRIWSSISSWFSRVVTTIASKMAQALGYIISKASQWVSSIANAMARFVQNVISGFVRVVSQVANGMSRAVGKVRSFVGKFLNAGMDLMRGLVNGIKRGLQWVVNAAKSVAQAAVNAAKRVLRIKSPSRVFRGLGQYVSQGLAIGITKDGDRAINAVTTLSKELKNAFRPELYSDLTSDMQGSLNGSVDGHMSKDIQHSMKENNRPIVNITVRNEGDIEFIKSYIDDLDAKDGSISLM